MKTVVGVNERIRHTRVAVDGRRYWGIGAKPAPVAVG
jgi:hypothetical protein